MNKITVNFTPCDPEPSAGYNILWRVLGSTDTYSNAGNFFVTPAVFYDNTNPEGTQYEGLIRSDCGTYFGNPIPWHTTVESITPPVVSGNVTNITDGSVVINSIFYGGLPLNYINGTTFPMGGMQGGNYSLPYLTSGDTLSIQVFGGAFTQVRVTDNAGSHILPYAGFDQTYFFTLTINPMFTVFYVEVS